MAVDITLFIEPDAPVGYDAEDGNADQYRPDFVGIEVHGSTDRDRIMPADLALIRSAVWGNRSVPVNTTHNQFATWDPCQSTGQCGNGCADGCCWYDFSTAVCCDFCSHPGMDIGVLKHTALYAAQSGRIEFAGRDGFYKPFHVDIRTPEGELHIYGHMWSIDPEIIRNGLVEAGQYLGTSGEQTIGSSMTPDGSGPHLHFERRTANGCAVDPADMLQNATTVRHCAPSAPPPFDGMPQQVGNVVFHPDRRTVDVAFNGLGSRRWANVQACPTREPFVQGESIDVLYWVEGETVAGEKRWWITTNGSRVHVGGTIQKPGAA